MKKRGIFLKVFTYTAIFLIMIVCVTVGLFSRQFLSFYNAAQTQQLYTSYQSLHQQLNAKSNEEIIQAAEEFYSYNQSFTFYINDKEGHIVFTTLNTDSNDDFTAGQYRIRMNVGAEYTLHATTKTAMQTNYGSLIQRSLLALACMLTAGIAGAFVFARQMTNPIKRLASDTKKMAALENVNPMPTRNDEIGSLACDVHAMYDKLKETIFNLESEILRVREMEETQRYFFSAASHELKTPIAAVSVLLEGMIENVGDYNDHPKYLRECIKQMDAQNKVISEILDIVNLNDGKILPRPEKLDIALVAESLLPSFKTLADANGQNLDVSIPDGQICNTDLSMLKKVLSNVIMNAVQNTPVGGDIRLWSELRGDKCRLCILNSGVNIDKEIIAKLFDPFYRIDKARSRKTGNSGLGLTIVKRTLEAMNAEFLLTNTDEGILFWMELPKA
jgi:two-component system sensor histidine kinase VanS